MRAHPRPRTRRSSPTGVPLGMAWHSLRGLRALGGGRSASCLTNDGIAFRTFCSAVASLSRSLIWAGLARSCSCFHRQVSGSTPTRRHATSAEHRPCAGGRHSQHGHTSGLHLPGRTVEPVAGNREFDKKKKKRQRETEKKHVKEYVITT